MVGGGVMPLAGPGGRGGAVVSSDLGSLAGPEEAGEPQEAGEPRAEGEREGIRGEPGGRSAPSGSAGPPRTGLVFTVLVLGGLLVVLDITIINVAIRTLAADLGTSLPVIQWVSTGYTLALAVTVPTTAWLVARFGSGRVYMAALGLFVLGSVLCGLAWNIGALIAFRVVQGIGGGLVSPVAMTIVLRATPPERRGRAMGLLGLPVLVGPVIGPTLGGWLVDISWRWIFLVNLPLGLAALLLASRVLRPVTAAAGAVQRSGTRESADGRLDVPGLALVVPGLALFVYGLAESGRRGTVASAGVLVPALVGLALAAIFVVRAARMRAPLVQVALLRLRAVASGTATLALFAAAYFGSMFVLPLYWQLVRGLSPAETGMLAIPQALATGVSLQVASRMVDRVPPARVVGFGIVTASCGLLTATLLLGVDTPYWQMVLAMSVMGVGAGSTIMPTITTALRYLSDRDAPSGSTLLTITNQVSVSIGTALTSVVLAAGLTAQGVAGAAGGGDTAGGEGVLPTVVDGPAAARLAEACQDTLFVPAALMIAALVVALTAIPGGPFSALRRPRVRPRAEEPDPPAVRAARGGDPTPSR